MARAPSPTTQPADGAPRLEARDLSVRVGSSPLRVVYQGPSFYVRDQGRKQILAKTSMRLEAGELVAMVGASGSGKTTLVRALAGIAHPWTGDVLVDGRPVAAQRREIGYLPQDEIVHERLSVLEALRYAARLRLPAGTTRAEREEAVQGALRDMELEKQARTRIGSLSGGERKRVGVGIELLSRPSLLFLDEPTTGLDPGIETRMMGLLRSLAHGRRTIVVATHATKSLSVCDKLAVVGRGGHLAFYGPPREAPAFFGVKAYDDIYAALDRRPAHRWRQAFERGRDGEELESDGREPGGENGASGVAPHGARPPEAEGRRSSTPEESRSPRRRGPLAQMRVLAGRYARLFTRDRRNLLLLVGQVPVIALAIVSVFDSGILNRPPGGNPQDAGELLFAMVTAAIWLGSIDAAREVVKERSVVDREVAVGVRRLSYLGSKLLVLFTLAAVQIALLCMVIFTFIPLDGPVESGALVYGALTLTSFVAIGLGLLISCAATTEDQATSVIPLTLIPQLLFTGALVPVATMSDSVATLSGLAFGQWSFASMGTAIGMNRRINGDFIFARISEFGPSFFAVPQLDAFAILGGFLLVFLVVAATLLRLRS